MPHVPHRRFRGASIRSHRRRAHLFKREDCAHTGAHKINNVVPRPARPAYGQAQRDRRNGAGQHGVATATIAARLGMSCKVFMGAEDVRRQAERVRMRLLGAEVVPVTSGTSTLKDAMNEALRYWVAEVERTFYIIGTVSGPILIPPWCATCSASSATRRPPDAGAGRAAARPFGRLRRGGSNAMGSSIPSSPILAPCSAPRRP
jgi:tryptophan synthase beta chain